MKTLGMFFVILNTVTLTLSLNAGNAPAVFFATIGLVCGVFLLHAPKKENCED